MRQSNRWAEHQLCTVMSVIHAGWTPHDMAGHWSFVNWVAQDSDACYDLTAYSAAMSQQHLSVCHGPGGFFALLVTLAMCPCSPAFFLCCSHSHSQALSFMHQPTLLTGPTKRCTCMRSIKFPASPVFVVCAFDNVCQLSAITRLATEPFMASSLPIQYMLITSTKNFLK